MKNQFTPEEIKTAKEVWSAILESKMPEHLKSVYMAGEVCMWDELQSQLHPATDDRPNLAEPKWISVEERLPIKVNEDGKRVSKWVMVTNGKNKKIAIYYPKHFSVCNWEDLDEEDFPSCVEKGENDYWLTEGWWTEFENMDGDILQSKLRGITHWMPLPKNP